MPPLLTAYGSLALAIVSEVTGSTMLLKTDQFTKLVPTAAMGICYVASLFFLSQALKVISLGVAYAIWAGLGIVLTALVGVFILRLTLDTAAIIGIALIVSGVVVMNVFSHSIAH